MKFTQYRTLRARLPGGLVDLAIVHPGLTVAEDNDRGFYTLSVSPVDDEGPPPAFFKRLNKSLSIPLKPEWAPWLWAEGQKRHNFHYLAVEKVIQGDKPVEKRRLKQAGLTPISPLISIGVRCYQVLCQGQYREAWLKVIREQLGLGIRLEKVPAAGDGYRYVNSTWAAYATDQGWALHRGEDIVARAASLEGRWAEAQHAFGVNLIFEEGER